MAKSPDAFRTISEVAELLDVPAHVLRFWESRFTQIKPVKRAGGRRYYRPADIQLLDGIRRLLHEDGMTIRGVQKLLREEGVRRVAGLGRVDTGEDAAEPDWDGAAPDTEAFEAPMAQDVQPEPEPPTILPFVPRTPRPETLQSSFLFGAADSPEPEAGTGPDPDAPDVAATPGRHAPEMAIAAAEGDPQANAPAGTPPMEATPEQPAAAPARAAADAEHASEAAPTPVQARGTARAGVIDSWPGYGSYDSYEPAGSSPDQPPQDRARPPEAETAAQNAGPEASETRHAEAAPGSASPGDVLPGPADDTQDDGRGEANAAAYGSDAAQVYGPAETEGSEPDGGAPATGPAGTHRPLPEGLTADPADDDPDFAAPRFDLAALRPGTPGLEPLFLRLSEIRARMGSAPARRG